MLARLQIVLQDFTHRGGYTNLWLLPPSLRYRRDHWASTTWPSFRTSIHPYIDTRYIPLRRISRWLLPFFASSFQSTTAHARVRACRIALTWVSFRTLPLCPRRLRLPCVPRTGVFPWECCACRGRPWRPRSPSPTFRGTWGHPPRCPENVKQKNTNQVKQVRILQEKNKLLKRAVVDTTHNRQKRKEG